MTKTIIACDFSSREELFHLLNQFNQPVSVKLGMEVLYKLGFSIVEEIKQRNHFVFVDLKLHDIPNTVYNGIKSLTQLNADLFTVHAAGGIEMMKAAVKAIKDSHSKAKCVAVTQLTSISQEILENELDIHRPLNDVVIKYALNAKQAGLDGVVCSVHEAKVIHEVCGTDFLCVTPGIRLSTDGVHDQKRVATPEYAYEQGSDFIVVGRSITQSSNPAQTFNEIETIMQGENNGN